MSKYLLPFMFTLSFFIFAFPDAADASSCRTGTWQEYCDCMAGRFPGMHHVGCDAQSGKPPEKSPTVNVISTTDPKNIIGGSAKYNVNGNGNDYFYFEVAGTDVKQWKVTSYNDDFSKPATTKTFDTEGYFFGYGLHHNVAYEVELMDKDGKTLAKQRVKIDGLQNPSMSSNPNEFDSVHTPPPTPSTPPGSSCDICGAVSEMKPAIDKVTEAVKENTSKVEEVKEVVETISDQLSDFHDEFKTDMDFPLTPMPDLPDYEVDQPKDSFKDETIYFKDEGDAPEKPGKMPKAPEPEHWDGLLPEDEMSPDKPLEKDKEQKKEKELEKDKERKKDDEKKKDEEMKREEFKADAPMQQEKFEKTPQMEVQKFKADKFDQTETYQKDSQMNNTHKYDRTNVFGGG